MLNACPKPRPGAYRLEQKKTKAKLRTDELKAKEQSKRRDGNVCRAPHASREEFDECRRLRLESGHVAHKGRGGDHGERSTADGLVTLGLRCHHERFDGRTKDGKTLRPKFLTRDRADGVIAWEEKRGDRWVVSHVEAVIGDANDQYKRRR